MSAGQWPYFVDLSGMITINPQQNFIAGSSERSDENFLTESENAPLSPLALLLVDLTKENESELQPLGTLDIPVNECNDRTCQAKQQVIEDEYFDQNSVTKTENEKTNENTHSESQETNVNANNIKVDQPTNSTNYELNACEGDRNQNHPQSLPFGPLLHSNSTNHECQQESENVEDNPSDDWNRHFNDFAIDMNAYDEEEVDENDEEWEDIDEECSEEGNQHEKVGGDFEAEADDETEEDIETETDDEMEEEELTRALRMRAIMFQQIIDAQNWFNGNNVEGVNNQIENHIRDDNSYGEDEGIADDATSSTASIEIIDMDSDGDDDEAMENEVLSEDSDDNNDGHVVEIFDPRELFLAAEQADEQWVSEVDDEEEIDVEN